MKHVSDIASAMTQIFESDEHKSLFGLPYKTAQTVQRHNQVDPSSNCDGAMARGECLKCHKTVDSNKADDCSVEESSSSKTASLSKKATEQFCPKCKSVDEPMNGHCTHCGEPLPSDDNKAEDCSVEESKTSSAFNVAIDSLLTASAALDSVGFNKSSALSLRLASFVVDAAKKKTKKDEKKKDDKKKGKEEPKKGKKPFPPPSSKKPASSKSSSSKKEEASKKK